MFKLNELPYRYDSLEPFIEEETMHYHHDKHHQTYVDNLNKALEKYNEFKDRPLIWLLQNLDKIPEEIRTAVRNNGGGVINHDLFFNILRKDIRPSGKILDKINKKFKSFENFKEQFSEAAATQFASGWAWLVINNNELEIIKTPNHDTPISQGKIPLLVLDVWEHAYYLKYKNDRKAYIQSFFNIINWDRVNELYLNALKNEIKRK